MLSLALRDAPMVPRIDVCTCAVCAWIIIMHIDLIVRVVITRTKEVIPHIYPDHIATISILLEFADRDSLSHVLRHFATPILITRICSFKVDCLKATIWVSNKSEGLY